MGKFSTIPAVKAALVAAIDAEAALDGVTIARGVIDPPQLEMVELFQSETEREYRGMRPPAHPIREELQITIRVTAMQAGAGPAALSTAEDRAFAICDAIDDAYRADTTLGGLLEMGKLEHGQQRFWRFDKHRGSVVFIRFTGQASFS